MARNSGSETKQAMTDGVAMTNKMMRLLASVLALIPLTANAQDEGRWIDTLSEVSSGVVSIRVDGTRAFDTEWNMSTQATGFIVDAERGLIMTNRHVVTPGPVIAEAIFINNEEVELKPVYRDPVHDFGIYRYDPDQLKYIEPYEFSLAPERAQVGREIRVVGNDAGEQLSILAGTIARLDREAPDYGRGKYNDFNTFYIQAASNTSGGSSGSPVIDINGSVIALNAGGASSAASSFYLPLDRVRRALKLLQADEPVLRGTLQTVLVQKPYDELRRLGLSADNEAAARKAFPNRTGMLVVEQVVPGSSAQSFVEPGDILLRVDDNLISDFVALEEILDNRVGGTVKLSISRGGREMASAIEVQDLHAISPDNYIEFGDAVVHDLSYQQARHYNVTASGVYVANPGYVFGTLAIPRASVITEIGGTPVENSNEFEAALGALADGERVSVRYFSFEDPTNSQLRVMRMDRRWFPARRCTRDDQLGVWPCVDLAAGPAENGLEPATTQMSGNGDPRTKILAPSLVMVTFDMPYTVSGVADRYYHGTGLIVDTERGLVIVDRNTVPVSLGDVSMTFAGSVEVPGRVVYVHPLHNFTVVQYDPALIGDTNVEAAELSVQPLRPGDPIWVVGLKPDHKIAAQSTEIASIDALQLPLSRTMRFTDANLETISVVNPPSDFDGVLSNRKGEVVAMWSSFAFQGGQDMGQTVEGIPADLIEETLELARSGEPLYSLETQFQLLPLSSARKFGLNDEWSRRIERHDSERRQVLSVRRAVAGSPAAARLRPGDLLLTVNDQVVNSFREVEKAVQQGAVDIEVLRDGRLLKFNVETVALDGQGLDRVVMWAGALLQAPHRAMSVQRSIPPSGVYVAYFSYGSPANRYGLWAGRRILAVDEQETPDLDSFITAVKGKSDRDAVRLKTVNWNERVEVITLKLDNRYWPAYEILRGEQGWERSDLPELGTDSSMEQIGASSQSE